MPANTQEGVPPTPFARALLRVCGQVFASATIPRAWLCASIVSIDKKDGDPLNPGDKRGIALINVGLKLVCKVLQMRIERFVETNNLLSYEQAGFRKREECVGQVVSLVDIIQRRQNAGLNTHVLFIDIRKAFDTVPVGALLWKLQNMGFPRRTLAFLKALYTSSSARARAGSLLSDPFPSLDYRETRTPSEDSCTQTMWQCLLTLSNHCWLRRLLSSNGPISGKMQFGVAKCGIISFTGHLAPRLDNPLDIRLHGQLVSRVESYKYLGVLIDSKLDHFSMAQAETWSWAKPIMGLSWLVATSHTLHHCRTTINKGIRLFTGARLSTAIGPLLVETGIGSLLTRSLVSRVRLLERSVTKRTPINAICSGTDNDVFTLNVQGQLVRSQRWFWSRRTKQLYRKQILADTTSQTKDSQATTLVCIDGDSDEHVETLHRSKTHPLLISWWSVNKSLAIAFSLDLVPAIQKSRLRLLGRALDPGVENVYTWLRGGVLNGEADLDQQWLDGTVEHESMGTRHDNRALAARLADFLQVAYRQYQSTLWKYHRDRLVEVG
ncbi:hypothetical protein BASA83_007113 [Batrachochytrium salamandrivorans]|nr:hypothetical protein BASA83_007113 [Batrachochytrium salamandrivorans]